jgi:hypothetical protein
MPPQVGHAAAKGLLLLVNGEIVGCVSCCGHALSYSLAHLAVPYGGRHGGIVGSISQVGRVAGVWPIWLCHMEVGRMFVLSPSTYNVLHGLLQLDGNHHLCSHRGSWCAGQSYVWGGCKKGMWIWNRWSAGGLPLA